MAKPVNIAAFIVGVTLGASIGFFVAALSKVSGLVGGPELRDAADYFPNTPRLA